MCYRILVSWSVPEYVANVVYIVVALTLNSILFTMLVKKGKYNKISVHTIKSQYMQQDVHIYNIISINTTRLLYIQQVFIIYNKISIYTTSFHYIQQEFYIYNMMCVYTTTFPICTTRII